jgi:hypothetical protein
MDGDHLENRKGAKQGIWLWNRGNDLLFAKLLSTFSLPNDKNSRTSSLRKDMPTCWIFQKGCIEEEIAIVQNVWCFKKRMFAKLLGTKSWGFVGQLTWITSRKTKEGIRFYHIEIRGIKNNKHSKTCRIKHLILDWTLCWCKAASNEQNQRWETRCLSPFSRYLVDNVRA